MSRILFLLFAFSFTALTGACAAPLGSIARIRALTPEEAARREPVVIEATVTFSSPSQRSILVHDGNDGIYVELPPGASPPPPKAGSRLKIEGVTKPGGFMPIVEDRTLTVLGHGPLPEPRQIHADELFSPSLDCQWVEVPAVVTGIENGREFFLIAEISGWTVKLRLPEDEHASERSAALMQQEVTVRGVVGSVFNAQRQLTGRHFFVPSFDQIIPKEPGPSDSEPRLHAVNELLRSDSTDRTRVRVRGVVTQTAGDGLYLRGEGGSLFVRAAEPGSFPPGTKVEAEGFAAVAPFRPILRAARVEALGRATLPEPEPLDLAGRNFVRQQAELVMVDADFLTDRPGADGGTVLQCRTGDWFFEALLPEGEAPAFQLGSDDRVRLSGVCELTTTRALPFSESVDGFRLHLAKAGDVVLLHRAPWWTLRRLLWALGSMGLVALVALAWAALLRKRVTEQTQIISVQIERAAVKDERQRIARELHDTIEQELAGLSVQLRNARQRLANAPERAGMAIELAERMLRHCREEARTSIRDLRSVALEQRGLRGALEELLAPLAAECGAKFSLKVEGQPHTLPGPVEMHILRIAHQAVSNAVQHAAPREIRVQLDYSADALALEIVDDGRGFDTTAPAPRGHFGILGLRERANKLHASLAIESALGAGATVRLVVPAGTNKGEIVL